MKKLVLATLLAAALSAPSARASIATSGNFQTGTPTPALAVTTPFTLTITTSGTVVGIALDEWVTNDNTETVANATGVQLVSYQINGGTTFTAAADYLVDNYTRNFGSVTPNDGYLHFSTPFAVTAGQSLTILPSTLAFASGGAAFNMPPAVFNGNVYAINGSLITLSNLASVNTVPEPSTWAAVAVGSGLLGFVTMRRRAGRA